MNEDQSTSEPNEEEIREAKLRSKEFQFERTDEGRATATYRCLSFDVESDSGEFSDSELQFWDDVMTTLNLHFPHIDDGTDE